MSLICKRFGLSHSQLVALAVVMSVILYCAILTIGGSVPAVVLYAVTVGLFARQVMSETERIRAAVRNRTLALQDLAYRDGLTGLPNRRFFIWYLEQYLPRQLAAGRRGSNLYRVVLFDLNGFKAVNDTYGHEAGDELLQLIANTLTHYLPADAVLARLGGDEFVVLVRDGRHGRRTHSVVRAIEEAARSELIFKHQRIRVSASVGVSSASVGQTPASELLSEADENMYLDKAAKREARMLAEQRAAR